MLIPQQSPPPAGQNQATAIQTSTRVSHLMPRCCPCHYSLRAKMYQVMHRNAAVQKTRTRSDTCLILMNAGEFGYVQLSARVITHIWVREVTGRQSRHKGLHSPYHTHTIHVPMAVTKHQASVTKHQVTSRMEQAPQPRYEGISAHFYCFPGVQQPHQTLRCVLKQ